MPLKSRKQNGPGYALFWLTGDRSDRETWQINTLVYREPGNVQVRTYKEGHLDQRAGDEAELPRFDKPLDAMDWMLQHLGMKCLVSVGAAQMLREDHYAEPV